MAARPGPERGGEAVIAGPAVPSELIRHKRDGGILSAEELGTLVTGITDGSLSDAQAAAFAMAVYFQGMTWEECARFTQAMSRSGTVLDWSGAGLEGPIVDKHSTGGVGDTVSLIVAPLVAACGGLVPMISGHGLAHTGGTLDKLASIPGYQVTPSLDRFRSAVRQAGCAIVGASAELAPADRRLYAIRDVTATVDSIPLITASILAKKLAAGLDALVMDVKVGSGSFTGSVESAQALAESLVTVAADAGLRTVAWITDMNQVLGHDVGNALEVREAIDFLAGRRREIRLHAVTAALAREMLVLGGLARDHGEAAGPVEEALQSGAAAERFARMVVALGGPSDLLEHPYRYLASAPVQLAVTPSVTGVVGEIDVRQVGLALISLGGGRQRAGDAVDPRVGLSDMAGLGASVGPDRPLALIHARSMPEAERAAAMIREAMAVVDGPPEPVPPPVLQRIGPGA
jgi:thymidine phosphorylase